MTKPLVFTAHSCAALREEGGSLFLTSGAGTDLFTSPESGRAQADAAFYGAEITGDFILRARVRHPFASMYDAASLVVWADGQTWAKLAFERTDAGTHNIVSVVTRGSSDDCTGPSVGDCAVWLRAERRGGLFVLLWSADGKAYRTHRCFSLPCGQTVQAGFSVQCPRSSGTEAVFTEYALEPADAESARAGE